VCITYRIWPKGGMVLLIRKERTFGCFLIGGVPRLYVYDLWFLFHVMILDISMLDFLPFSSSFLFLPLGRLVAPIYLSYICIFLSACTSNCHVISIARLSSTKSIPRVYSHFQYQLTLALFNSIYCCILIRLDILYYLPTCNSLNSPQMPLLRCSVELTYLSTDPISPVTYNNSSPLHLPGKLLRHPPSIHFFTSVLIFLTFYSVITNDIGYL